MRARITEVFESVQGEGLYLGERQIFVRFFGCNLSCQYCDTKLDRFMTYDPEELWDEIKLYEDQYHSISFTGGEPLLQATFLKEIMSLAAKGGYRNYLETNGTLPHELARVIEHIDIVAMDFKFPSSSGMHGLWNLHKKFLKIASTKEVFLKAVVCQDTDEEDLKEALALIREINKAAILVLQPNYHEKHIGLGEKLNKFKDFCRKEGVTACVIPQIHKEAGLR